MRPVGLKLRKYTGLKRQARTAETEVVDVTGGTAYAYDDDDRGINPTAAQQAVGHVCGLKEADIIVLPHRKQNLATTIRQIRDRLSSATGWQAHEVLTKLGCRVVDDSVIDDLDDALLAESIEFLTLVDEVVEAAEASMDGAARAAASRHALRLVVDVYLFADKSSKRARAAFYEPHDGVPAIELLKQGRLDEAYIVVFGSPRALGDAESTLA